MKKVLFISYDGMTDPLGQSQVIPYLAGLRKYGYSFTLLSFEKQDRFEKNGDSIRSILDDLQIRWEPRIFTTSPPILSKLYDLHQMNRAAAILHEEIGFDFIHCRSYVSAGAGIRLLEKFKVPFLFDMRGFWVDERVDNGQWDLSRFIYRYLYRQYKKKEKIYLRKAKHIISLTENGKDELAGHFAVPGDKVTVIPCCADLEHFSYHRLNPLEVDAHRLHLHLDPSTPVLTYLGSLGGWYLTREMLMFFKELKSKVADAKFLFISHDSKASVIEMASGLGISPDDIIVKAATRSEVPFMLALSKWSVFFIKDAYSKKASSPTKQGEIMAMGIPLVCNDIGDTGRIIARTGAGVVVPGFSQPELSAAVEELLARDFSDMQHIRQGAIDNYDLSYGVQRYADVYKLMAS